MPRIKKVEFISQLHAEKRKARGYMMGLISITSPRKGPVRLKPGWYAVLPLEFDDLEEPKKGAVVFGNEHADKILSWLEQYEDRLEHIVVHCRGGISRSAAIARFIADRYRIEQFDREYDRYNSRVLHVLQTRIDSGKALNESSTRRRTRGVE